MVGAKGGTFYFWEGMDDKGKKGTTQKASKGTPMDPRNGTGPVEPPIIVRPFPVGA